MNSPKLSLLAMPACLLLLIFSSGCTSVVERNEVMGYLHVDSVKGVRDNELRITGMSGGSAYVIASVVPKQDGSAINLLVSQKLVGFHGGKAGETGNFDYTLKVPAGVNTVTFGKKKEIIWQRPAPGTKAKAKLPPAPKAKAKAAASPSATPSTH